MNSVGHDRSGTRLNMLCTYDLDSGFESYWKYVCDGDETGLNQPLN